MAEKAESQEICFVGKRSYADFVAARRPDVTRPGEIVDAGRARRLGEHAGWSTTRSGSGADSASPPGSRSS